MTDLIFSIGLFVLNLAFLGVFTYEVMGVSDAHRDPSNNICVVPRRSTLGDHTEQ